MAGKNGGPWGGGGGDDRGPRRPDRDSPQIPEIDEIMKRGQERLKVLMGGRGGGNRGGDGPGLSKGTIGLGALALLAVWAFASFYTVRPEERSVELFLGEQSGIGDPGLNFAPWPLVTYEVIPVTREQSEDIGMGRDGDDGLMLTTDENIVDIDFQVVWNITNPAEYLFNLRDGPETVRAVSESAMREIVAGSELAPLLNRDRALTAQRAKELIQATLDSYQAGINVVRVNLNKADPPNEVIDAFRDVQAAEQERDRLERQADAYANRVLAEARGQSAQVLEDAEGYRAQVVNDALGEASRFLAVLNEYQQAPDVTRRRLYIETLEKVLGDVDKIILDENVSGGEGVVPYLPLNELRRNAPADGGGN
ncbi:FtsH protease activity modulator HflK [Silicimonas algicola]|uniref:Protein HflK n=1 Tax=Silicimonas algicola TaxID=1826607 RepID=A0A316G386_9RHOB|nr:FtsH protease activity modulator HflK [Silicimonas algicola]AZQ66817.1 FtsH protease activity modulator HflK [Silicimonas algicola]PWK55278.1 protease FtsH subunit HflK [Silicimonas algicola]